MPTDVPPVGDSGLGSFQRHSSSFFFFLCSIMTAHLKCSHSPYACVHRNNTVTETYEKILPEEIKQYGLPHGKTLKVSGSSDENFKPVHF